MCAESIEVYGGADGMTQPCVRSALFAALHIYLYRPCVHIHIGLFSIV